MSDSVQASVTAWLEWGGMKRAFTGILNGGICSSAPTRPTGTTGAPCRIQLTMSLSPVLQLVLFGKRLSTPEPFRKNHEHFPIFQKLRALPRLPPTTPPRANKVPMKGSEGTK